MARHEVSDILGGYTNGRVYCYECLDMSDLEKEGDVITEVSDTELIFCDRCGEKIG